MHASNLVFPTLALFIAEWKRSRFQTNNGVLSIRMPFFRKAGDFFISNLGLRGITGSALVLGVFAFYLGKNFVLKK